MRIYPKKLFVHIGGYGAPFHSIELSEREVSYKVEGKQSQSLTPTEKQWTNFRKALDSIGVWAWKKEYETPGSVDGTNWRLEITYEDAQVSSYGRNSYPKANGSLCDSPCEADEFNEFVEAVRALIGGLDFY